MHWVLVTALSTFHCGLEFSSCDAWAQVLWGTWDLSSQTKSRTHVLCIGRQILNHWTTRKSLNRWNFTWMPNIWQIKANLEPLSRGKGLVTPPLQTHSDPSVCPSAVLGTLMVQKLLGKPLNKGSIQPTIRWKASGWKASWRRWAF